MLLLALGQKAFRLSRLISGQGSVRLFERGYENPGSIKGVREVGSVESMGTIQPVARLTASVALAFPAGR